jgi:hypothetical protein
MAMQRELEGTDDRRIRIQTIYGAVEGTLRTSAGISTLHYLNVMSTTQKFITLRPPLVCSEDWSSEKGPLAFSTDSILFVVELSDFLPPRGVPQEAAQYQRSPVRVRIAEFIIDGFVHVQPGKTPISRVIQDPHPFIALTSVEVSGPGGPFEVPFMAACHRHIVAVQENSQNFEVTEESHDVDLAER